jgi:MbtH protein
MHNNDNALPNDITIDGDAFVVLVNAEGQHSIWPARKEIPEGWSRIRPAAPKGDCLNFIEANWTDMRPRSLREC